VCTLYGAGNFHSLCEPSTSSDLWPEDLAWDFSVAEGDIVEAVS
jgi:hypothetical protein